MYATRDYQTIFLLFNFYYFRQASSRRRSVQSVGYGMAKDVKWKMSNASPDQFCEATSASSRVSHVR
jgi:hypothetical protein